ncbi:hypothetical protein SH2C18_21670 [Clostridium sediminicola]|uniref:TolC family protein n=1 Tax=Clostridium sediminicola TaxID=3114879 RepID=UPI0031F27CD2
MNYDLDTPLEVQAIKVPFEKYTTKSLDDQVDYVLANNGELVKLQNQSNLASIELDIYEDYNSSGKYDSNISKANQNITNLVYDILDKRGSLEYEVRSQYNNLLNSYDALSIKELEISNLAITLNTTEKRYEVGLESKNNLALAKENLAFAQLELDKAKLDYYVAVETYKNFVD